MWWNLHECDESFIFVFFCFLLFHKICQKAMSYLNLFIFYSPCFPIKEKSCIWHVGAGISTLISVSDRLGTSMFRRNLGWTRPMSEGMEGKVFISRQSRNFSLWCCVLEKCPSLFVPLLGVQTIIFPAKEKV